MILVSDDMSLDGQKILKKMMTSDSFPKVQGLQNDLRLIYFRTELEDVFAIENGVYIVAMLVEEGICFKNSFFMLK